MKLHYDVSFDNTPLVLPVEIEIQSNSVVALIGKVPDVGLSLNPRGGGMEAIIAAILDPAAEWFVGQNMGSLDDLLGGERYELASVHDFEFGNMIMTAESLSTAEHSVDGKPVLKLVPVLKVAPMPESAYAEKSDEANNYGH